MGQQTIAQMTHENLLFALDLGAQEQDSQLAASALLKTTVESFLNIPKPFVAMNSPLLKLGFSVSRLLLTEFSLLLLNSLYPRSKKPSWIPSSQQNSFVLCLRCFPTGFLFLLDQIVFKPYFTEFCICLSQRPINAIYSALLYSLRQKLHSETRRKQWLQQGKSLFLSHCNSRCKGPMADLAALP